jgi:hypothetical protein
MICHGFDQQLLFINVNTFRISGKKMRFVNFDFGIGEFGILILELRCPKLCRHNISQNSSALIVQCHSMAPAPGYLCRCDPNQRAHMLSELRHISLSQLCTLPK